MKKIIILSLVAATHMFAFEVSEAEIISKDDQTYSTVTLGDTSFDYASSKDNKALFTQKYCDNGDEGYSVVLSNDNVDFKMQYDSCTGETSVLKPPQTAAETAANITNALATSFESIPLTSITNLIAEENKLIIQPSANRYPTAVTFDANGNFVGKGMFVADLDGDGKNDYQIFDVRDIGLTRNSDAGANTIDSFNNVESFKGFDNFDMATGVISEIERTSTGISVTTFSKEDSAKAIDYVTGDAATKEALAHYTPEGISTFDPSASNIDNSMTTKLVRTYDQDTRSYLYGIDIQ